MCYGRVSIFGNTRTLMFWILNKDFSQDWGGELSSILCVTAEHPQFAHYNEIFVGENGRGAIGGYVVLEYLAIDYTTGDRNGDSSQLTIGFDCPAEDVYNRILDQIAAHNDTRVLDIRGFNYVGLV